MRTYRTAGLLLLALLASTMQETAAASASDAVSASACPSLLAAAPHTPLPSRHVFGPNGLGPVAAAGTSVIVSEPSVGALAFVHPDATSTVVKVPSADLSTGALAADSAGNTFHIRYPNDIVKYDQRGDQVWIAHINVPVNGVFILGSGPEARVGAVHRDAPESSLFTVNGEPAGMVPVHGHSFSATAGGGVVATDGRYVRLFDATGAETSAVGDVHQDNDATPAGSPLHFYQLGGAAQLPDGHIVATDTQRGLMVFSDKGLLEGSLPASEIDPLGLTQSSGVVVSGDKLLIETGQRFSANQYLTEVSIADVLARTTHGESGNGASRLEERLGLGAGLITPVQDGYFPPGTPVDVRAYFDPWWQRSAAGLSLCWTMQDQDEVRNETHHVGGNVPLSAMAFGAPGTALDIPRALRPGAYEMEARLVKDGKAVSTTTMVFTVGADGQRLDLPGLPAGADSGGPGATRGVALADELGTKTVREGVRWSSLLKDGPDAALNLVDEQARFAAADAEAQRRGVTIDVQVGTGGAEEKALVANGSWERRVSEVVSGLKASVHVWEAWNEPNLTYGSPTDYVHNVLAPFYRAVKKADPSATVIGGSTAGVSPGYWDQMARAGAFGSMDVAGIHPYTGHNRSWEEDGTPYLLGIVKDLIKREGHSMPLWNTEQAFWSNGPSNLFGQADSTSREVLWSKAIGVDKWAYFIPEGSWGNDGVTFSAIEVGSFVKPAALALMTATSQVAGRPFLGQVDLGSPSTYGMRFGPKAGDPQSGELLAVWTEGLRLPAVLSGSADGLSVTRTEELGASTVSALTGSQALTLDSAPVFLALNGPGQLNVSVAESFGTDLALASQGATATASSDRPGNEVGKAIDGRSGADGGGDLPGLPAWASAPGDTTRTLDVHLASPQMINRVLVSTHSIFSIVTGLRDYDVQVRTTPNDPWITAREVRGQFQHRSELVTFPAQQVSDIRVHTLAVNYSGYLPGGARPSWWPTDAASQALASSPWYGPAVISELSAYAPGTVVQADSAAVQPVTPPAAPPVVPVEPSQLPAAPAASMPAAPGTPPIAPPIDSAAPPVAPAANPPVTPPAPPIGADTRAAMDAAATADAAELAAVAARGAAATAQTAAAEKARAARAAMSAAAGSRAVAMRAVNYAKAHTSRWVHLRRARAAQQLVAAARRAQARAQAARLVAVRFADLARAANAKAVTLTQLALAAHAAALVAYNRAHGQ